MATESSPQLKRVINPEAPLHKMRERRHRNGRDLKCVITQRDSETGGGKTTLACWLAMCWDRHGWDGEEKGTVSVEQFLDTYPDLPPHSVLIMDEAEQLDARRSMAQQNVDFSEHWMTMRTRQIDSILTLPTASALDKRLLELADIRINVVERGLAYVYRVKVDDHNPADGARQWFMHELKWPDVSDHPEAVALDQQKQAKIDQNLEEKEEEAQEDREFSAKEIKQKIIDGGDVERYIRSVNGGTQQVLDKGLIGAEYEISEAQAKRVKSLLMAEVDDDVM
jgi:hypothetical protein